MALTTALRLTGRDVLPLLHRVTTQALADLAPGEARATLWCDFRGRLQHRAVVAHARDGGVWLLRWDAPGDELAAVVDRSVFRDDVRIEDRSAGLSVTLAQGRNGERGLIAGTDAVPREVSTGDGTRLVVGGAPGPLAERERIALVCPRHRHEVRDEFNPFEVGLAHEVHLDKGCYTGQEALQRLVTYESVRRRPVVVRLASAPGTVPQDVLAGGERAGVLTSAAEGLGIAIVRREAIELGAALTLADGAPLVVAAAPEPARPLGRP
jgi:hypothetical protein